MTLFHSPTDHSALRGLLVARAKWIARFVLAGVLLVAVATTVGWREIGQTLATVDMKLVILSWTICLAGRWGQAYQLSRVMGRVQLSAHSIQVLIASSLSALYGLVLPGDLASSVAKWAYLSKVTSQRSLVFNAILYNRVITTTTWATCGVVALSLFTPWNHHGVTLGAVGLIVGLLLAIVALYHPLHGAKLDRLILGVSRKLLPARINERLGYVVKSTRPFRQFPWRFHVSVIVLSCTNMLVLIIAFGAMAAAVGIHVPLATLAWVWTVIVMLSQLPISFQGVGVREVTLVVFLTPLGVPEHASVTLGLLGLTHFFLFAAIGLLIQLVLMFRVSAARSSNRV